MIHGTFTIHVSGTPSELSDTLSVSTIKIHKLMKFGLTCFAELHGTWPLDDTMLHTHYPYSQGRTYPLALFILNMAKAVYVKT